jgi:hypothetical protein
MVGFDGASDMDASDFFFDKERRDRRSRGVSFLITVVVKSTLGVGGDAPREGEREEAELMDAASDLVVTGSESSVAGGLRLLLAFVLAVSSVK